MSADLTIQIIEDDRALSDGICMTLATAGMMPARGHGGADEASAGNGGMRFVQSGTLAAAKRDCMAQTPSLAILDLNLPDGNGLDFLRWLRARTGFGVPVLILTANDLETDEVAGFALGADDYVTKPFRLAVLRARVQALLRRAGDPGDAGDPDAGSADDGTVAGSGTAVCVGNYVFDFSEQRFSRGGETIFLSPTEAKLLRLLVENRGRLLTRELLGDRLWGDSGAFVDDNALSVTVNRLRAKLADGADGISYIQTVYGQGYRWQARSAGHRERENG